MREQHYQTIMTNISNGRVKPTQPPSVPQDYYGTLSNRPNSGRMILSTHVYHRCKQDYQLEKSN